MSSKDFSFIIPSCIRNEIHMRQFKRCIESIRKFHNNKILIIDNSDLDISEIKNITQNIIIHKSIQNKAGECLTFYYILHYSDTDLNVCMHDSMILEKKIEIEKLDFKYVKFLWHFTHHIVHWDSIEEPSTNLTVNHNIKNHTDLLRFIIKNNFHNNEFVEFCEEMLIHKNRWVGCMGTMSIIDKNFLIELEELLEFIPVFNNFDDKRKRVASESIFPLLCYFYFHKNNINFDFQKSLNGLYFDGFRTNPYFGTPCNFDNLFYNIRGEYMSKICFFRP